MNDIVIVVTGAAPLPRRAVDAIPTGAIVLAADGALDHALAAGLAPAGLVGDLDSVSADGLAWAEEHSTIQRHPPDKDHTDTELALATAADLNPQHLTLISGGGDRIDHTFAAIGALGASSLTSIPTIDGWWGDQRLAVVHGPGRARLGVVPGSTISLLALQGACSGVSIGGVRWPLDRADLGAAVGLGVSNEATGDTVDVSVNAGVLTVFVDIPESTTDNTTTDNTTADNTTTPNTEAS
jgi:thiamine pyrophosphokinase